MKTIMMFSVLLFGQFFMFNPVISFEKTHYDFGTIPHNIAAEAEFSFENTGTTPFVLEYVKGSCGCTIVDFSKDAVQPGGTATIKASYNAKKKGVFKKTISVKTSIEDEPHVLTISGLVE